MSGAGEEKDLCRENLMANRRMLAALILQVSLLAFWRVANNVDGLILSTYVQDHLILLMVHILHTHHRGLSSSVAIHTLTSSVLHHHHRQRNHSTHRRPDMRPPPPGQFKDQE